MTRAVIPEGVAEAVAHSGHGRRVSETAQLTLIDWYETERSERGIEWGRCFCGCGGHTLLSVANKLRGAKIPRLKWQPLWFLNGHGAAKESRGYVVRNMGFISPCWVMGGYKTSGGYAMIGVNGNRIMAHRYYYELVNGSIPKDLQLDHLCRVRDCVNPEHLEPVTPATNRRRGMGVTLGAKEVTEIRRLREEEGYKLYRLAKRFGVSKGHISDICSGKKWANIERMGA